MTIPNRASPIPPTLRPDLLALAAEIPAGARVLDLGCGDGALLEHLVRSKGVRGRGVELSEAGVLACVRRGLTVRQGNLDEGLADYPDQTFDYVILSQTLAYLNHPRHILHEMLRVGSFAVVSFTNWGYWRCRLELLLTGRFPTSPDIAQTWHGERRFAMFTVDDFRDLCRSERFVIARAHLLRDGRPLRLAATWRATTALFVLQRQGKTKRG